VFARLFDRLFDRPFDRDAMLFEARRPGAVKRDRLRHV
jgi:hypothetical protein